MNAASAQRRVLVTGASGLIGTALVEALAAHGDAVVKLVRRKSTAGAASAASGEIFWDPTVGAAEISALEDFDAVVHLAGEPVVGRWTAAKKERIRRSRVELTRLLCAQLARCERKPRVLVSASAIGFYGDRGDEMLTEASPRGKGFLAETCVEWEAATQAASGAGIRVAHVRTGIVQSQRGGALRKMLPFFRMGIGGRLGSGKQWMSWIALEDEVAMIQFLLENENVSGPVNAVSPQPVTNSEFTRTLAKALRRPAFFPVPEMVLQLQYGGFASEGLLASSRVFPEKVVRNGFVFQFPELDAALRHALRADS